MTLVKNREKLFVTLGMGYVEKNGQTFWRWEDVGYQQWLSRLIAGSRVAAVVEERRVEAS